MFFSSRLHTHTSRHKIANKKCQHIIFEKIEQKKLNCDVGDRKALLRAPFLRLSSVSYASKCALLFSCFIFFYADILSLLSDVSASLHLSVLIRLTPERPPVAFLKKRNKVKQICNTFHRYLICLLNFPPPEFLARKRG